MSSAGLGEALQRSANSLNAAGSSLDESIALIAAANTTAQNPESVGNALKVVSARIRGAKSELEEMGEETDTLAASTSKLRDELMALTGVDIMQADGQTFKTPYEIFKSLSEVWDKLSDVSQANVLELIAGKLRANVVAGLINNFDIAEEALKTSSEGSDGSALEENAKMLDSIQGKLNQLKATAQETANALLNSDTVKKVVDFLSTVLEGLNWITDKLEVFPTLISASATKMLNVGKLFDGGIPAFLDQFRIKISDEQLEKLNNTKEILNKFWDQMDATNGDKNIAAKNVKDLKTLNSETQQLIINAKNRAKAEKAVTKEITQQTLAQKAANTALSFGKKLGSLALNAVTTVVLSLIISKIYDFVNAAKEAEAATKELMDTFVDNTDKFNQQSKSLNDMIESYNKAMTATEHFGNKKSELIDIQDQLNDSYKDEESNLSELAGKINIVKNKYSETIKEMNELKRLEDEEYLKDNQTGYEEAKKWIKGGTIEGDIDLLASNYGTTYGNVQTNGNVFKIEASGGGWVDSGLTQDYLEKNGINNVMLGGGVSGSNYLYFGGDVEDQVANAEKIRDIYRELANKRGDKDKNRTKKNLAEFDKQISEWKKSLSEYASTVSDYEQISSRFESENAYTDFVKNSPEFEKKLDELTTLSAKLQDIQETGTSDEKLFYTRQINSLYDELKALSNGNEIAAESVDNLWNTISENIENNKITVLNAVNETKNAYAELISETNDTLSKNYDILKNAVDKIKSGEGLTFDEVLNLQSIDPTIISKIASTTDGYVVSINDLIAAKDALCQKSQEEITTRKEEIKTSITRMETLIDEAKLERELILIRNGNKINSEYDYRAIADPYDIEIQRYQEIINSQKENLEMINLLEEGYNNLALAVEDVNDQLSSSELLDIMTDQINAKIDNIDEQINQLEDEKEQFQEKIDRQKELKASIEDRYDTEINKLKELNEEKENENKLEEARQRLEKAGQRTLRVWRSGVGWVWEQDQEELKEAQQEYDSALLDDKINKLEKAKEEELKIADDKIKELENYSEEHYDNQIAQLEKDKEYYTNSKKEYEDYVNYINEMQTLFLANELGLNLDLAQTLEEREDMFNHWMELYNNAYNIEQGSDTRVVDNSQTNDLKSYAESILNTGMGVAKNLFSGNITGAFNALASPFASNTSQEKTVVNNANNQTITYQFGDIITNNSVDFMKQLEAYLRQAGIKSIIK